MVGIQHYINNMQLYPWKVAVTNTNLSEYEQLTNTTGVNV